MSLPDLIHRFSLRAGGRRLHRVLTVALCCFALPAAVTQAQERERADEEQSITREEYTKAAAALREAVVAGEMTRQEAGEKMRELRERVAVEGQRAPTVAGGALKQALKEMTDAEKLTAEQAADLYRIVHPEQDGEEARFEAFLKETPELAEAIASGKISREQALAGFRARTAEAPSEEELLDAAHRWLVEQEPELARTPREQLMPRLKQIVAEGPATDVPAKLSTDQRIMTFGRSLNELIERGQVERFDEGLKKVHDIGVEEIRRQGAGDEKKDAGGEEEPSITREEYAKVAAELREAVAAGEMTREQAGEKLGLLRQRIGAERREPAPVDWEAKYTEFLEANPQVKAKVASGDITKEQVLAGIKAREKEATPPGDEALEALIKEMNLDDATAARVRTAVESGRISVEDMRRRLGGRGRGDGDGGREGGDRGGGDGGRERGDGRDGG